jgi:serine/threonine-protein kinase
MELLEGESLAARIARSCRCGLEETDAILQQVCRGLRSAHAQRLVHRDIKPGNIFLTPQPDGSVFVRLLDFGIAKEFDADQGLTLSGEIVGTGYYMSPEQLRTPQDVGAAADIWALGVVVYEMLTGCVPFDAASFPGLVVRIAEGKFRPPSRLHADLPPALDAYFKRALHVQPDRRFASVDDMSAAFSRILREHDLGLKPEPRAQVEPTWQAPGRKRFADLTTDIVARRIRGPWRVALLVLGFGSWALVVRLGLAWLYAAPAAVLRPAALAPPKRRRAPPKPIAAAPVPASPSPLPAEERNYGF